MNIPDIPYLALAGYRVTGMGSIRYRQKIWHEREDGEERLIIKGKEFDINPLKESDGVAVHAGYVSITPLKYDLTDREAMEELKEGRFEEWDGGGALP